MIGAFKEVSVVAFLGSICMIDIEAIAMTTMITIRIGTKYLVFLLFIVLLLFLLFVFTIRLNI